MTAATTPDEGGEPNPGHEPKSIWPLTKNASPEPTPEVLPEPYVPVVWPPPARTNAAAIFSTSAVRCHATCTDYR
jgi:hypothetical protein